MIEAGSQVPQIEILDSEKTGKFSHYSTAPYIPKFRHHPYEIQATFTRQNKPTQKYFTDRKSDQYDRDLRFQGNSFTSVLESLTEKKGIIYLLDVGCGEGYGLDMPPYLAYRVARFGITASEFRTPRKKVSDYLEGIHLTFGNAELLTNYYPRNFFDVVISEQALHHMDQALAIPQIVEVMMPGGIAMLNTGSGIVASRTPRVMELESHVNGVAFRKTPGL